MDERYFCGLTGRVVSPLSPGYHESRLEWNRSIQKYPLAIVYCRHKYDVSNAILWAKSHCLKFRIRSGGHNYEGYSTGDDLLVIDVSQINHMALTQNLLTVGGGATLSELYDFVSSQGRPFPGGTCPTVGVSGFALGGGWGLSCRKFGLGCDNLVGLELVDCNGRIIAANATCNSDLFWACRGAGGGNFGVIVSMTFLVPPKTDKVTYIRFDYPSTDQQKQSDFLAAWQDWLCQADDSVSLIANIYRSVEDGFAIHCVGLFYGKEEEASAIIAPLTGLGGCNVELEYITFLQAITQIEGAYPCSEKFKSTGRFVVRPLDASEVFKTVGLIRDIPDGSVLNGLTLYALGGKVAETSRHDTAFFYRDAQYIIGLQSVWEEEEFAQRNIEWVRRKFHYLRSVTEGSYVNFPYGGLVDPIEAYFGENAPRLRAAKAKYDPLHVFQFPQSIRQIR